MERTKFSIKTNSSNEIVDITKLIESAIQKSGWNDGFLLISIPHTTAAVTINENYDPDVKTDFIFSMRKISPDYPQFKHSEGNSDSHVKASLVGRSETIAVINGELQLGRWEGVWFCEFDGPRTRDVQLFFK
ncbi:YjbQ family protein [bacterium]|nr:YjbQ family protein [bacterium]